MDPSEEYEEHASSIAIGTAETGISFISVGSSFSWKDITAEVPKLTEGMGLEAASVWGAGGAWGY